MNPQNVVVAPNFTQLPNIFCDYWMGVLTPAEFKVLICVARKTFGWSKTKDTISLRQIQSCTNLSKEGIIKCLKSLEEHGLINKIKSKTLDGDDAPNQYEIIVLDAPQIQAENTGGSQLSRLGVVNSVDRGVVNSVDTQYKDYTKEKPTKHTPPNPLKGEDAKASLVFGKFVKLSQSEYDKLCLDHGKPTIDGLIDELNDYCAASKPKGYNDYAAAIRQWLRRRKQAPTQNESARTKLQQEDDKRELAAKNRPIGAEAATHFHKQAIKKGISINLTHDFIQIGVDKIYFNDIKFLELLKHTTQKFGMT